MGVWVLGKMITFNNACLAKLGWRVLTDNQNWCVQIIKNKYLKNKDFLNTKIRQNHFCAWKGILKSRNIIEKGMRWIGGNGENILFQTHNCVFPFPISNLVPSNQANDIDLNLKVSQFINNGHWDRDHLRLLVDKDTVNSIRSIPLPLTPPMWQLLLGI